METSALRASPVLWGEERVIAQRLGAHFGEPAFERGAMAVPALSLAHYRSFIETSVGPMQKLVESIADSPERLEALRREFEATAAPFYSGNVLTHTYVLTRASAANG